MSFSFKPITRKNVVSVPGMIVWCGTMVRSKHDGRCHLFLSVWPEKYGFDAWIHKSDIAYAVADSPDSEYEYKGIIFPRSGKKDAWDRDMAHNPWVIFHNNKFYMYYTGNYGNLEFENHRFTQRVGVAVADNPMGPWTRLGQPLNKPVAGSWDELVSCNPSVCQMPNGQFIMLYRACSEKDNPTYHGDIMLGVAFADTPEGPFIRHPEPIFRQKDIPFAAEDPGVFIWNNRLYAIFKDMGNFYNPEFERSLILAESENGENWKIIKPIITRNIKFAESGNQEIFRLERPFVYMENNIPKQLFVAAKPFDGKDSAYNIHIDISLNQREKNEPETP